MYIANQYMMYHLASEFIEKDDFEIIHFNIKSNEIWLEKYEKKISKVIRITSKNFNWKNHLKSDIASVFQRVKRMKELLIGKQIKIYNIYIASDEPVDDWDILKKPMQLKEKNPLKMDVFYFTKANMRDESMRFINHTNLSLDSDVHLPSELDQEKVVAQQQHTLMKRLYKKNKEKEDIFSYGKPHLTYVLIALNLFLFMMLELKGSSLDIENLIANGAKYNPAIINGEWWRIISSMFLHIGIFHLFMNMLALYYLGMTVERIYGSIRFLLIYLLAGIGGGLVSFAFSIHVSAGASGAIFGLFGALLFFGINYKKLFLQTIGKGLLVIVGINLLIGFFIPQIDMGAHVGGLITGFLASAVVHLPNKRKLGLQILAFLTYVAMIIFLVIYGVQMNENNPQFQLLQIEEKIPNEDYAGAIEHATTGLNNSSELEAELLFQRAYAYIELGNVDLAILDLERSVEIDDSFPESFYNLALLYYENRDFEKARETIQKAQHLKENTEAYEALYDKIMNDI